MKTKKIVALLLSLAVMLASFSLLCVNATAVEVQNQIDIPDGESTYTLDGVTYTVVRSAAQMNELATANASGGVHYILDADLVYSPNAETATEEKPTFTQIHLANGSFNGNGHSITGVAIALGQDAGNNIAMFKFTNDAAVTVSNLTVGAPGNPVTVTCVDDSWATNGSCRVGTLFGYLQANALFENVTVYSNVSANGNFRAGGFVGEARKTLTMKNCVFNGTVTVTNANDACPAGGLIGHCYNMSSAVLENCASYGTISSGVFAGGLIGGFTNTITMTNCANYTTVTGTKSAGLIADAGEKVSGKVTMNNCFNAGAVTGTTSAAGLIGTLSKHNNVAYNDTSLTDCANIGIVTGGTADELVAIVQSASKLTVTNCGAFGTVDAFKTVGITKAAADTTYTPTNTEKSAAEALKFMQDNFGFAMFGIEENKIVVKTVPAEAKFLQYRTDAEAGKMDIRVIGVINATDLAKYTNVGFNVSLYDASGETPALIKAFAPQTTTVVYKSVNANEGGSITTYSASDLGATYLYALELQGIPTTGSYTFEITAFATEGENTISDSVVTVTVVSGVIQ